MVNLFNQYLEASGEKTDRAQFDRLVSTLDIGEKDPKKEAIAIRDALWSVGFSYDPEVFTAQDIMQKRRGNCLGLPLLVGAIMGEQGINPEFQILVNPKDAVWKLEQGHIDRLNEELRYDFPELARHQEDFPIYRFAPLEHIVIGNGTTFLETTTTGNEQVQSESARPLTFQNALSCVYKDRAINEDSAGRIEQAKLLAHKGLKMWGDNRQIHALLAGLAYREGDTKAFGLHRDRFESIDGNDSLFFFNRFLLSGDQNQLDEALNRYPAYAQVIAAKADALAEQDPRESRFLYAVASHLYANSTEMTLRDFYSIHSRKLQKLFGKQKVLEGMQTA